MVQILDIHFGDTGALIPIQFIQPTDADPESPLDLTGYTVEFKIVTKTGRVVVEQTDTGVAITDAATGTCTVQLETTMGLTGCEYALYAIAIKDGRNLTAPVISKDFILRVHAD